jgi:DNA polymerase-1
MARLRAYLERHCDPAQPLALCGDFNVAPEDIDAAYPESWTDSDLCSADGRAALERIREWGLVDVYREHNDGPGHYSWWDYRNMAVPRNDGLRIDHVFATRALAARCTAAAIDHEERSMDRPSDHVPVKVAVDVAAGAAEATLAASASADATSGAAAESAPAGARQGPPKLVLIDGHSVAYRAFYGLPLYDRHGKVIFSNSRGEFTNAVYGFANMLIKTWSEQRPDYIAVAFDLGRTFRDDMFEDYKGTREKMPDELSAQMDRIFALVDAFGIPAITADGYEADDILGTLAKRAGSDGIEVLIVTGDSDAFQLIDERIHVQAPGRLWSEINVHDEAAIRERYGLDPVQLIDYKALVGDSSDNIPGVRGVGKKTAGPLLQQYDSVEGIYEHLDEVEPTRARNALSKGEDMALLSKDLITIRLDVPIELEWEACAVHDYDRDRVEALFDELEFRGIRSRLPEGGRSTRPIGTPAGTMPAAPGSADPEAAVAGAAGDEPTDGEQMSMFGAEEGLPAAAVPPVTDTTVITDLATLAAWADELAAADVVSFDVESTSTDAMQAMLVGIALTSAEGRGAYVPVGHSAEDEDVQLPLDAVAAALAPVLGDAGVPKVAHNAKYDMAVLRRAGIEVAGLSFDTMLAEFLIDPGARMGLKILAQSRLGVEMTEIKELIGTGKKQITMDKVPIAQAAPYAAADVDMTLRLMGQQQSLLEQMDLRRLLDDVDLPLLPVLLDMEQAGVLVDTDLLGQMSVELAARLVEIEDDVYHMVGQPFNINSPQQLADVLFEQLALEAPRARKTRTGRVSVAADVLESMRGMHPVIDLVLEHRQISKLKGTYVDALPRLVNPETGRVHTSFNQTGAVSGRLASQDPNLQNIPIRTELGREVRRAFIVPEGWRMIAADYSQVELRVVAHICGDPGLRAAFAAGEDIHRATAATVLGVAPDDVTPNQRSFAKRVNFGLLYGMGTRSLAQQAGISMKEAQEFVDAYFNGFPHIKSFIEDTKRKAHEDGYVETLLGRRRNFPILVANTRDNRTRMMQAAAEREAINHPVQGSAADIIKIAMIHVHRRLREGGYRARMLLQVHDELVLEAPSEEVDAVSELLTVTMEEAYPLDPALKVDLGSGANWLEVK